MSAGVGVRHRLWTGARSPRATALVGLLVVLVLWQMLGMTVFSDGRLVPTPTAIVRSAARDWSLYPKHIEYTVREAGLGWLLGNGIAVVLGVAYVLVPISLLGEVILRMAVALYCVPVIAIAPILIVVFGEGAAKIVLAASGVVLTTLIGIIMGFRSISRAQLELVAAYGGGRFARLRKLEVIAALPATFAALKIAAPAAMIGALIGEYLGGEYGLGVAMVSSQETLNVTRTWALAIVTAAIAGAAYAVTAVVGRLVTPWVNELPGGE